MSCFGFLVLDNFLDTPYNSIILFNDNHSACQKERTHQKVQKLWKEFLTSPQVPLCFPFPFLRKPHAIC